MINKRFDLPAHCLALLVSVLFVSWGNVWAASDICKYPLSDSGIGGTGVSGSGFGGTGGIAKGSGIGGTGVRQDSKKEPLLFAGKVIFSQGIVEAKSYGRSRFLTKGDPVCVGEAIATSQTGTVEIRMSDGGSIVARPETHLKIEKYSYNRKKKDNVLLALFKGTCRIVTGAIGKNYPQNDLVKTPTVLIGIRGTDHEATVILPGGNYPPGTYDKVNQGVTFIRTEKGEVDIHANQVGYAASPGELPVLLKETPAFYLTYPSTGHDEARSRESGEGRSEHPEKQERERSPEKHELPGAPEIHERHEAPDVPDRFEAPDAHELPEAPELPELPDIPDSLELPEVHD